MSTHPSTPTTDPAPPRITRRTPADGVAACQRQFDPWNRRPLPNGTDESNASSPGVASR